MSDAIAALVDLTLEREALGQILGFELWPAFTEAGLVRDDFFREEHRLIVDAIAAVHAGGGGADITSVGQYLRASGDLDRIKAPYLAALLDGIVRPAGSNILWAVARFKDLATGRLAAYAATNLQERLKEPGAVADGAITQHFDQVQQILDRQLPAATPWLDVDGQLQAHARDLQGSIGQRVFFALGTLDEIVNGVAAGEVCGLMARPGIGKTLVLSHIARAVAEHVGHVFFSLEMPGAQIVARLKQMVYGVGRCELERGARAGQFDDAYYRAAFQNLVIVDTPGLSVAEMARRVRQIANGPLKHVPVRLVTIDHLGLIGGDRALSTYDRVSVQARETKELAKRLETAVLLAIQVNRESGGDGSRELGLGSARDSGVVEEAMDYLIGIRRLDRSVTLLPLERERYRDVIFVKVIKNRHGDPRPEEIAYRFSPVGLRLQEDAGLRPEVDDITRMAQVRGARR
jgi:replicative DNA helicase